MKFLQNFIVANEFIVIFTSLSLIVRDNRGFEFGNNAVGYTKQYIETP